MLFRHFGGNRPMHRFTSIQPIFFQLFQFVAGISAWNGVFCSGSSLQNSRFQYLALAVKKCRINDAEGKVSKE